jgi:hypothetical protein
MWRDVVGVVARRLPSAYEGATFVDIVSTAGSTLRILPWTRVTGEPIDGDGERRARELVELVTSRCPDARLDPATRAFIESRVRPPAPRCRDARRTTHVSPGGVSISEAKKIYRARTSLAS